MDLEDLITAVESSAASDDPLDQLEAAVAQHGELTAQADQLLDHFVRTARTAGCSWAEIGERLGVTKQAAQQRHGAGRDLWSWFRRTSAGRNRMFARFTDRARTSVVAAQQAARDLKHNYIGTEHLLVGILSDEGSVAAIILERWKISRALVVREIVDRIGRGEEAPMGGHIPFTPRARKALALSLRQALNLQHNYIGTEHILLGLLQEGDGIAAQILADRGVTLADARTAVADYLEAFHADPDEGDEGE